MKPAAPYPAYYCPPGMALPSHVGWHGIFGGSQILEHSPDGQRGMYYGTGYDPDTKDRWQKTAAGWYVLLTGQRPEHFARLRTMDGQGVVGSDPTHRWLVPQLLRWDPESLLVCAADEVYRDGSWRVPDHLAPIIEGLRAMALCALQQMPTIRDERALELGVAILQINYHISLEEMNLLGWMTTGFLMRVLRAAMGETKLLEALDAMEAERGAR